MIEKRVLQFAANANDSGQDPPCIDLSQWERVRFQMEAGSVAIATAEYTIYMGLSPTELREPPDLSAARLNASTRITAEFDVRSLASARIALTTVEGSTAPVTLYALLSREVFTNGNQI